MRRLSVICLALLLGGASCHAQSKEPVFWSGAVRSSGYEMEIIAEGRMAPVYHVHRQAFIEGQIGERYVVRMHNHTGRRVEAVLSIDGRDAIDGRPASPQKRGYIIPEHSFIDVDGFRLSMREVAAFRFSTVERSYAALTGTPWTVGVIGVAIFPEYVPYPRPPYVIDENHRELGSRFEEGAESRGKAADEHCAPQPSRNLGTKFGERRTSPVTETAFLRENTQTPEARLVVRYDDTQGLCSFGVSALCPPPYQPWPPPRHPLPDERFSNPPPGWEHFTSW